MRCWARTATSTSFAFRRTRRCRDTPGCVRRGNSAAMPPAFRGPRASKSSTARRVGSAIAAKTSVAIIGSPPVGLGSSPLPRGLGAYLEQRQVVAVGVRKVRGDAIVRLDGRRVLELHPVGREELGLLSAVVRLEHNVVAPATRLRGRSRIQFVLALEEDQFEVLSFGADGEPAGVPGYLVVRALLEPEHLRVELKSSLLVAHDDGHVGHFLDHGLTLRDSITLWLFNHFLILTRSGVMGAAGGIEPPTHALPERHHVGVAEGAILGNREPMTGKVLRPQVSRDGLTRYRGRLD